MGSCAYVTPLVRKKQEIVELAIELEEMGELDIFVQLVLEHDILGFYADKAPSSSEEVITLLENEKS